MGTFFSSYIGGPVFHPIDDCEHPLQYLQGTLFHTPARFYLRDPDIVVSCGILPSVTSMLQKKQSSSCVPCRSDPSSRSSYSRISRGPPPNNQMGGRERRGSCTNNDTETVLKLYQDPNVLRKVQGLNAQAKGEVQILISGRGRAIQAKGEVLMGGGQ